MARVDGTPAKPDGYFLSKACSLESASRAGFEENVASSTPRRMTVSDDCAELQISLPHRLAPKPVRVDFAPSLASSLKASYSGTCGSFTGAIKDRVGRIATAEKGTLFLDEIGELPLDMQSKLLRFLLGKNMSESAMVARGTPMFASFGATNRDLKKAVAAGRFQEDIFYRRSRQSS